MLCLVLTRAFLFITIVTAAVLHSPQYPNQLIATSTPYNLSIADSRLISQLNTTAAETGPSHLFNLTVPNAPSTVNDVLIDCGYGHELEYDACLDALNTFVHPFPDRVLTIGQRRAGGVWDLELPIQWMSGDGYCTWDIIKTGQAPYSLATGRELVTAATQMLDECVRDNRGNGGTATHIGARGDISLVLKPFIPRNVECLSNAIFTDHCNALVSSIPASDTTPEIFGPEDSPLTTIVLPKAWASPRPNGCIMAVFASSGELDVHDSSTFYDLWQALVTVKAMCVRQDKIGKISGLGSGGKLTMAVIPEQLESVVQS